MNPRNAVVTGFPASRDRICKQQGWRGSGGVAWEFLPRCQGTWVLPPSTCVTFGKSLKYSELLLFPVKGRGGGGGPGSGLDDV